MSISIYTYATYSVSWNQENDKKGGGLNICNIGFYDSHGLSYWKCINVHLIYDINHIHFLLINSNWY